MKHTCVLLIILAFTGAAAGPFYLFGFSGGAQFAHRYVLAHPDRVAAAGIGAAGWYTFPDSATPYPYGLGRGAGQQPLREARNSPGFLLQLPCRHYDQRHRDPRRQRPHQRHHQPASG